MEEAVFWMSVRELAAGYRTRELSPVEVTEAFLKRIDAVNADMNVYITVTHEEAMEAAQQAEAELLAGNDRGMLHGIPVAVKDLMDTAGVRTTYGSTMFDDNVPEEDATVVGRLKDAGAVILGKTNTDAFAFGVTTENPYYGTVQNPWNAGHVAGGSSGGSGVAVSAGLATVALGSDTAGSVRIPGACCGIVGLKPTAGRVSRNGVLPLSWTLDHVGTLARNAADAAALLATIAGPDPQDPLTEEPEPLQEWSQQSFVGVRVGLPTTWFFDHVAPEIDAIVNGAIDELANLGAQITEVDIGNPENYFFVFSSVGRAEATYAHDALLRERAEEYLPGFREFLEDGQTVNTTRFLKASRERERIRGNLIRALNEVDLLVSPTMPTEPPQLEQEEFRLNGYSEDVHNALMRLMYPFNLSGQPAVSVPCGLTEKGLPVGLQLAGQLGEDIRLLGLAAAWLRVHAFGHPRIVA